MTDGTTYGGLKMLECRGNISPALNVVQANVAAGNQTNEAARR
jgi:hypothetical protein